MPLTENVRNLSLIHICAGSSEKSSLIKDGIIGMLNSNIISTNAMAESMAVMVMYLSLIHISPHLKTVLPHHVSVHSLPLL